MFRLSVYCNAYVRLLAVLCVMGCQELESTDDAIGQAKRKKLAESEWHTVSRQDLAILLPRTKDARISITQRGPSNEYLFDPDWMTTVAETFSVTDVRHALDQNQMEDWQIVSIRIDPCSPLGKVPGQQSRRYCWPEIRVVWQPIIFDHDVGWRFFEAFSDDRAIHVTYRIHSSTNGESTRALVDRVTQSLGQNQFPSSVDDKTFTRLRQAAISELLGATVALRAQHLNATHFSEIGLRAETQEGFGQHNLFNRKLVNLLDRYTDAHSLHTLTAFSLPPGRDPEGINSWVFLSFAPIDGVLTRTDIQVASARTGKTLIKLTHNETVAAGDSDFEVKEMLQTDTDAANELAERVLYDSDDLPRLRSIVNDPNRTLVANTTCATCHSFNDQSFNFHNLSYLQESEITVAPRVRNDVDYNLSWLAGHR